MRITNGWWLLGVLALSVGVYAGQRSEPEQYPGQHNHAEPPKDYYCSNHQDADKAHVCFCPGMVADPMCRTTPGEPPPEPPSDEELRDGKCSVWCYRDRCRCKMECDT